MPLVLPPAGSNGLPRLSTRTFQLIDQGYPVWTAVWIAINEFSAALVAYFGAQVVLDIGEIR